MVKKEILSRLPSTPTAAVQNQMYKLVVVCMPNIHILDFYLVNKYAYKLVVRTTSVNEKRVGPNTFSSLLTTPKISRAV